MFKGWLIKYGATKMKAICNAKYMNPQTSSLESRLGSLLFSYEVKKSLTNIVIHQKETNFNLTIEMEKLEQTLRVIRFKLSQNPKLLLASEDLHAAADIEIVLLGLISLSSYVERHEINEVLFILPQEEAIEVACFEGLFEEISPLFLGQEKRVSLTLSCTFQDFFVKQIANIKTRIHQELWTRQREDNALKNYLQNRHKGKALVFQNISAIKSHAYVGANIIKFPIGKNNHLKTTGQKG